MNGAVQNRAQNASRQKKAHSTPQRKMPGSIFRLTQTTKTSVKPFKKEKTKTTNRTKLLSNTKKARGVQTYELSSNSNEDDEKQDPERTASRRRKEARPGYERDRENFGPDWSKDRRQTDV